MNRQKAYRRRAGRRFGRGSPRHDLGRVGFRRRRYDEEVSVRHYDRREGTEGCVPAQVDRHTPVCPVHGGIRRDESKPSLRRVIVGADRSCRAGRYQRGQGVRGVRIRPRPQVRAGFVTAAFCGSRRWCVRPPELGLHQVGWPSSSRAATRRDASRGGPAAGRGHRRARPEDRHR